MKITMRTDGFEVSYGTDNERHYLETVLNRLVWIFDPTIITWDKGIRIEGAGRLRDDVILEQFTKEGEK